MLLPAQAEESKVSDPKSLKEIKKIIVPEETKTKEFQVVRCPVVTTKPKIVKPISPAKKTPLVAPIASTDALSNILRVESGNNPMAVNRSSGACGLGQALPCSKMLNALGVSSLSEATYEMQLGWVKSYIANRYGSAENAWAFWQAHGWY